MDGAVEVCKYLFHSFNDDVVDVETNFFGGLDKKNGRNILSPFVLAEWICFHIHVGQLHYGVYHLLSLSSMAAVYFFRLHASRVCVLLPSRT